MLKVKTVIAELGESQPTCLQFRIVLTTQQQQKVEWERKTNLIIRLCIGKLIGGLFSA